MDLEDLARQAGLIEAVDFRRERGQQLTSIEQRGLDGLMEFGRLVRNEALEEAAKVCDSVNHIDNPMTSRDCAAGIRALKAKDDRWERKGVRKAMTAAASERWKFDTWAFVCDVEGVIRARGAKYQDVMEEIGFTTRGFEMMRHAARRGTAPRTATILAFCNFLGLDPLHYLVQACDGRRPALSYAQQAKRILELEALVEKLSRRQRETLALVK